MTLIEVVAGLVVLAVLVSSVTLARGRLMRQWAGAEKRLRAADAADRLLAGWLGSTADGADAIPVPARGPLEGVEGCIWQTDRLADPAAERLGAILVRVDVFDGRVRLLSVDVLKHIRGRAEPQQGGRP
ncbi:MAG TPA: hypothetical protein VH475_04235 [Tepidisphaeraceae bacterium]